MASVLVPATSLSKKAETLDPRIAVMQRQLNTPVVVPPARDPADDDVTKRPGTMAALFLAVALLMCGALLVAGLHGPSKVVDTRTFAFSTTEPAP